MSYPKQRTLSFAAIESRLKDPDMTDEDFAAHIGVQRKTMTRWRNVGLRFFQADELACRLGYHPTYFWGDDWFGPMYEDRHNEELESVS